MFGDFYAYDKWHQNTISATNTNNVQGQQGFWMRRIYFTYDLTFSDKLTTRFRLEANSNGQFAEPGQRHAVREGRLPEVDVLEQAGPHRRYPADPHLRLVRGLLGPAPHREDA